MTHRVEFRREGGVIGEVEVFPDLSAAKRAAELGVIERDADIALVIDVNGTGTEVASIRHDKMVWDNE